MSPETDPDGNRHVDGSELDRLVDARRRQTDRRSIRVALFQQGADTVRAAFRVHLLPADVEAELVRELAALDDRLAILRHCDPRLDPRCVDLYEHARVMRERVGRQLRSFVIDVDVSIGVAPTRGSDWTSAKLAHSVIRSAGRAFAGARRDLVTAVDTMVDSELLRSMPARRAASPSRDSTMLPEFTLAEFDVDSMDRVNAFIATLHNIVEHSRRVVDGLRTAALRHETNDHRSGFDDSDIRRRQALAALDGARAVHAAIAEVDAVVGSALTDPGS